MTKKFSKKKASHLFLYFFIYELSILCPKL